MSESLPIHGTFREAVEQLAGASDEFQRLGVSFLCALLQPDPTKRLNAEQALEHPFLNSDFLGIAPDSMPPEVEEEEITFDTTLQRDVWAACIGKMGEFWDVDGDDDALDAAMFE